MPIPIHKIKYFYRMEIKDFRYKRMGVYTSGLCESLGIKHQDKNHPIPSQDRGINRYSENAERCGFESLTHLQSWFSASEIQLLEKHGARIVRRRGILTARGGKQVLFIPNETLTIHENMVYSY